MARWNDRSNAGDRIGGSTVIELRTAARLVARSRVRQRPRRDNSRRRASRQKRRWLRSLSTSHRVVGNPRGNHRGHTATLRTSSGGSNIRPRFRRTGEAGDLDSPRDLHVSAESLCAVAVERFGGTRGWSRREPGLPDSFWRQRRRGQSTSERSFAAVTPGGARDEDLARGAPARRRRSLDDQTLRPATAGSGACGEDAPR